MEQRLEELADATPHKGEVVLTSDLEALLTEHAHELDGHLDRLKVVVAVVAVVGVGVGGWGRGLVGLGWLGGRLLLRLLGDLGRAW